MELLVSVGNRDENRTSFVRPVLSCAAKSSVLPLLGQEITLGERLVSKILGTEK